MKLLAFFAVFFVVSCGADAAGGLSAELSEACRASSRFESMWSVGGAHGAEFIAIYVSMGDSDRVCVIRSERGKYSVVARDDYKARDESMLVFATCTLNGILDPAVFAISSSAETGEDVIVFKAWRFAPNEMKLIVLPVNTVRCVSS